MRFGSLLLTALSAMIAVSTTSGSAQACCCGWGGWGYRPAYYYPQPMYYGPSMSNMPSRPMPGMAPSRTKSVAVNIKDDKFDPGNITIQPGTAVRFTNNGKHIHTVTAGDGRWDSRDIPPGQTFTVIFMAHRHIQVSLPTSQGHGRNHHRRPAWQGEGQSNSRQRDRRSVLLTPPLRLELRSPELGRGVSE